MRKRIAVAAKAIKSRQDAAAMTSDVDARLRTIRIPESIPNDEMNKRNSLQTAFCSLPFDGLNGYVRDPVAGHGGKEHFRGGFGGFPTVPEDQSLTIGRDRGDDGR